MYVASLNSDYHFKKVFSNPFIAQRFLEDFFGITIESIELVKTDHKLTDDMAIVVFDFRCKINGEFVIIEMQQWHKSDVVKRFYLYQAINTVVQIADIPTVTIESKSGKIYNFKNYKSLMPATTLVWMVNDNLNFEDDFVAYSVFPEKIANFVNDTALWNDPLSNIEAIIEARNQAFQQLNNKHKDLGFLQENRLVFAFQKNILKNKKYSKYFDWFELAEKSQLPENTVEDFLKYTKKNNVYMEVVRRLTIDSTASEPFDPSKYEVYDADYYEALFEFQKVVYKAEVKAEMKEEVKAEVKEEVKAEVKQEVEAMAKNESRIEAMLAAYERGFTPSLIADVFGVSLEYVEAITSSK